MRSLGADNVIDYTKEDFSKNGEDYHVIFDAVGKTSINDCMKSLQPDGVYLQVVATPSTSLKMKWASIGNSKTLIGGTAVPQAQNLEYLKELVETGEIKPVIDRTYPIERIIDAHGYVDKGHKKGNVVIIVDH